MQLAPAPTTRASEPAAAVHRSLHASNVVTSLCWIGSFLLGSIPIGYLLERRGLRRDLRRLEDGGPTKGRRQTEPMELLALLTGGGPDPATALPAPVELAGAALDTAKVIALVEATLILVRLASPGFRRGDLPPASDVGFLTDQILTFWQSAALWAGLAAAVGHLYPIWLGFRGRGQGQAPLLALAVLFIPIGFVIAVGVFLVTTLVGRSQRISVALSLTGFVAWSWSAWLWSLGHWWGLLPGPELAIWAAVTAGVVAGRTLGSTGLAI